MSQLTSAQVVQEIKKLGLHKEYKYPSGNAKFEILNITEPHGPITVRTWQEGESKEDKNPRSISQNQIATIAHALRPNYPIHVDSLFQGGGNTRQTLEAALANTPSFFMCYPGRVDAYTGQLIEGAKHIMWCPDDRHPLGTIVTKNVETVISETTTQYGDIEITEDMLGDEFESIEAKRTHTKMQIALLELGHLLGYKTWIAKNDKIIEYKGAKLEDHPGVVKNLSEMSIFHSAKIREAAEFVDCIWFTADGSNVPAVIEVEHSTGVTPGLTRMSMLKSAFPLLQNFVVVAPNSLKGKVASQANERLFQPLKVKFLPYSNIQLLYGLVQKFDFENRIGPEFLDAFLEEMIGN